MRNAEIPEGWIGMDVKPGQTKEFKDLPGWKVYRFLASEMAENSENPYLLFCSEAHADSLRLALLINNLPEFPQVEEVPGLALLRENGKEPVTTVEAAARYPWLRAPVIPKQPRIRCRDLKEAWTEAQNLTPVRWRGVAGWREYTPDFLAAAIILCEAVLSHPDLQALDIFRHFKTSIECVRNRPQTCLHMLQLYAFDVVKGGFDIDHPQRHLQLPDGNPRHRLRVILEFRDFFGSTHPDRIGETLVQDFITYVVLRRQLENPREAILDRDTIMKNIEVISGLFDLALKRGAVTANPFAKHSVKIKSRFYRADKEPSPHSIDQLTRLIVYAWKTDLQICFALVLGTFCGLRRCEMLRSLAGCIDLVARTLEVTTEAVKKGGEARVILLTDVAFAWLSLFELGAPGEPLLGPIKNYARRLELVKQGALTPQEIADWGKDKTRKNYSIGMQYSGIPEQIQKLFMGHPTMTDTLRQHYHGKGSAKWALRLMASTPENLLGPQSKTVTYAERLAMVPVIPRKPREKKAKDKKA